MTKNEPHGRDVDEDGLKKRRVRCCVCRSTKEHRCYKCFCGECPSYTKKFLPRYGVKDQLSDSRPFSSSSLLHRSEETTVPGKVQMDTNAKQLVKTSDPCTGDERPPVFSSNSSTLRSSSVVRSGKMANGDEDRHSEAILPNSRVESGSSSRPLIVKEQRGNDEAGNQKLVTNEVDGGFSKSHAGSASVWDILAAKKPRASGNQEGWATRAGSISSWAPWPLNEQRGHSAGSVSSWSARRVDETRGNKEVMADRAQDGSSKPASPIPGVEYGSKWTSSSGKRSTRESEKLNRGNADVSNQKVMTNEVDGRSLESHAGSTSIWDILAAKEKRASGNEVGWANRVGSGSSWGTCAANELRGNVVGSVSSRDPRRVGGSVSSWDPRRVGGHISSWDPRRVGEPRGIKEITANRAQDGASKPYSLSPHVESVSRWKSDTGKRSRDEKQRMANRIEDVSPGPVKKPRGNQEIVANTTNDGSSKPVLLKPNVESGSSRVPCTVKQSRGNKEVRADRDGDGSCKSVSRYPSSESSSSWDANIVKDRRGNADTISRNPEVKTYRSGDGSSDQVIQNHHVEPGSSLNSLIKEPIEMGYKTGSGSFTTALHDLNAGVSSLTAKEPAGFLKESVQDGQQVATIVSRNIKGVKENKKIIDPDVETPRLAKPLPFVISGESCSSMTQKFHDSEKLGPAKEIIWKGKFEFHKFTRENRICEGYLAHLAARVNAKAYKFASEIAGNLQFMMHPRSAFWPNIFTDGHPDARDIALYFYPQRYKRSIKEYAELLQLIEKQDLMLRSVIGQVELLVFSSKLLHTDYQRLKGRHYFLWGVFRQLRSANVFPTPHMGRT